MKRALGLTAAAAAVVLGAPLPALAEPATTLYVNNYPSANCSDSGSGTQAQPYCTLTRAAQVVEPGQTVEARGDAFTEDFHPARSGTADKPITFAGISHGDSAWAVPLLVPKDTTALALTGVHDVVIRGFYLTTPQSVVVTDSSRVTLDRNLLHDRDQTGTPAPAVRVTGQSDHVTISRNTFQLAGGVTVEPGSHDVTITTNEFGGGFTGISATDSPGLAVTNNTIASVCGPSVALKGASTGGSVQNNIIDGYSAALRWAPDCSRMPGGWGDATIAVAAGSTDGTTVDFNVVHPRETAAAYTWGDARYSSAAEFNAATGQGARDTDQQIAFATADGVLNLTEAATAAIDSANPAAPGVLPTDLTGRPALDDPLVAGTPGSNGRDRGARELQGLQWASLQVGGADFYSPQGAAPLAVKVTATVLNNWPTALTYTYDFHDGTAPVTSTDPTVRHTYTAVGRYLPSVTVQDALGARVTGTATNQAVVNEPGPLTVSIGEVKQTQRPLEYTFQVDATSPWRIQRYEIDPGDGSNTTYSSMSHTYPHPGSYDVTVTATDESGRKASTTKTVDVDYTAAMKDLVYGERVRVLTDTRPTVEGFGDAAANYTSGAWRRWTTVPAYDNLVYPGTNIPMASAFTANGDLHVFRMVGWDLASADWRVRDFQWGSWQTLAPLDNTRPVAQQVTAAAIGNKVHVLAVYNGRVYQNTADYDSGTWSGWADVSSAAGVDTRITRIAAGATGNVLHIAMVDQQGQVRAAEGDYDRGTWWSGPLPGWLGNPTGVTQLSAATVGNTFHVLALAGGSVYQAAADYSAGSWSGWYNLSAVVGLAGHVTRLAAAGTSTSLQLYAVSDEFSGNHVYNATGDFARGVWRPWAEVTTAGAAGTLPNLANLTAAGAG
ncbi:PKD domain-containing protein [Kitasatospora sp. NPDC050463]|uniref:PKD domain-containing protein n=1 Tax=Kitasatospora sp. NPDC050463 TaxID=3155786 RepID=UPI0033E2F1DB